MRRGYSTKKVSDIKNERAEGEISSNVFECPPDFEAGAYIPLGGLTVESAKASSTEVWLIQAPTDFSPQCLTGMMIPLEGFERVTLDKENKHYRIMSSCQGMPKTGVVLPVGKGGDKLQWAPVLKGMISITEEAVGMANGSGKIHPVPVPPPPSIPEGLRQRFKPFGYSQPAGAQGHIADRKETTRKKRKLAVGPELVVKVEPNWSKRAKEDKKSRANSRDETVPCAPLAVQVKVEPDEGHRKAHGRKKKNREKNRVVAAPFVVDGSNLAVQVKEEAAEERNGNEAIPEAATRRGGTEPPLLCLQDAAGESEEGGKEEVKPKKKKKSKKDRKEEAPLAAVEISELSQGVCAAVEIEQGSTESRSRKKKKKSRDKEKTAMGEGVSAADLIRNEADDGVKVKTEMESWDLIREETASSSAYPCVVPKVEAEQNEPSVRRKKKKRRDKDADDADDAGGEGRVAAGTTSSRSTVAGDAGAADVEVADIAVDDTEPNPVKREDEKEVRKKKQKKKKKEDEKEKHVAVKREEPPSDAAAVDEHALRKRSKHKQSEEEIPNADVGEHAHKKTKKKKKK